MEEKDYEAFFQKYLQNRHTAEEHERFLHWFRSLPPRQAERLMDRYAGIAGLRSILETPHENEALIRKIEMALDRAEPASPQARTINTWTFVRRFAAAAMLVLVGLGGYYLYHQRNAPAAATTQQQVATVGAPGGNRAMLTLADGSSINLNDAVAGQIAVQSDIEILKVADGQLVYSKTKPAPTGRADGYNRISTPKAGQYQVNLSDGTRVWLNSLSSIRFPATFSGDERKVEISGEVYFEVAPAKVNGRKVPFLVVSNRQVIEVLGTHFNVNSYQDEGAVTTTLLEGSVKVYTVDGRSQQAVRLKPGEQSVLQQQRGSNAGLKVEKADTEGAIAWQKGFFKFKDTDIQEVMRQLSRWYDLDVVYKGPLPQDQFTGYVSKNVAIGNVLEILEEGGGVKFRLQDKRVEVTAAE